MRDMADKIIAFARSHPWLSALALGPVAALGYPPVHAWWIALPAVAAFLALLRRAPTARSAAWLGWLFGWSHLTIANNWIATAFTHQAKMPEFLGWLAVPLLCLYLAVYPALAAAGAHLLAKRKGVFAFALILAAMWILTEWLRSWVFTGYPWPPLGLMLLGGWETPGAARVLPWMGTYALSGLAILFAGALLYCVAKRSWIKLAVGTAALFALMFAPAISERPSQPVSEDIAYTLVQPLLTQDEINDPTKFEEQFARITDLTVPGREQSRLVLWPESAVPDYLEDGYPQRYYDRMTAGADPAFARQRIGAIIGPDATLLTGAVNLDFTEGGGIKRVVSARNSVLAIDGEGGIQGHYAKAHLVPYGEYLPMRPLLEPLGFSRLVAGSIDYLPGPGARTLDLGAHGKAGIQICYEIVFSGQVADRTNRPDYIFNPSNDGWFGIWGPPQHLAQARMRAIEEGLPVLRSTTTGISAVIDARGVVVQTIPYGAADAIRGTVPAPAPPTLFAKTGNALAIVWAALLLSIGILLPRMLALRSAQG